MANLIKVKFDDTDVWMEVEEKVSSEMGPQRVSVSESIGKALDSFSKISDTIRAYCVSLIKTFKTLDGEMAPARISTEFGLKISGEGNVYVVKSAAEASLKITAEWEFK